MTDVSFSKPQESVAASGLRVLHIINGLGVGGAENMLLKLASAPSSLGVAHEVVSLDNGGPLLTRYREAGVTVHCLALYKTNPRPRHLQALGARIREFDPTVIHGWMYYGNLAALIGRWWSKSRASVAWNIRQTIYDLNREKVMTALAIRAGARLSRRTDGIVYISVTSALQHENLGYESSKRILLPNGFDCTRFAPDAATRHRIRQQLGLGRDDLVVALVARYHPMKDHKGFVAAAALLARESAKIKFLIVGHEVTSLHDSLLSAGIRDRTVLQEVQKDTSLMYKAADIACSSSAWGEGFSNAIGEAMACGLPCVVTDVGDSALIVGGTGRVVPRRNPEALAAAMASLLTDDFVALGRAARRRIETEYSLEAVVARYESFYRSLSSRRAKVITDSTSLP